MMSIFKRSRLFMAIASLFIILFSSVNVRAAGFNSYVIKFRDESSARAFIQSNTANMEISSKPVFSNYFDGKVNNNGTLSASQSGSLNELRNYYLLKINGDSNKDSLARAIKSNPDVLSFEPNYIYRIEQDNTKPNDPRYGEQWALNNINAALAWQKATGKGVLIGVIDTGIDFDHPDLKNQLWINPKEDINHDGIFEPWPDTVKINGVSGDLNGKDDDGNGFVDDVIGYDFVDQSVANVGDYRTRDAIPQDENSHGTEVAGVIAAQRDNNKGITGLAYNAKIVALRAFDGTGNAESDDIAAAIMYAAFNGVKILNFSFGEELQSPIMHDAIKFAYSMGCIMLASSGNNGWARQHFPSDYDEVMSIGSSDKTNQRAGSSNYGSHLAFLAPGESILTTQPGGGYKTVSGTSFSAPHAAAAAALIKELHPEYTQKDLAGILTASATDYQNLGWDIHYGSGILNVGDAVNITGSTNFVIQSPVNEQVIDRTKTAVLNIYGSVVTPFFDSYQVLIGKGRTPSTWLGDSVIYNEQVINNKIGSLNISTLSDTVYTLRFLVNLKNHKTTEKRTYINIISPNKPLEITLIRALPALFNQERIITVAAVTNQPSAFSVEFHSKSKPDSIIKITDEDDYTNYHNLIIGSEALPNVEMQVRAIAIRSDGDTAVADFTFTRSAELMPVDKFRFRDFSLPLSYVNNYPLDLYGDGRYTISVNDLSGGGYGIVRTYEFNNITFNQKDSLDETWLPVAMGESNGNGIPEVLVKRGSDFRLYESKNIGGNPFSNIIFQSTDNDYLTPIGMYDIDKDGQKDLIFFSDSAFHIYSYKNGKYTQLARTGIELDSMPIGTAPGFAAGDFDGDGNIEFVHSNQYGSIYIYKYINGSLQLDYIDSSKISNSEQYITTADIDGDGNPEIVLGNFGSGAEFDRLEAGEPLWQFRILKYDSPHVYKEIWKDYVYGVRGGLDYKNGIAAGNLDGIPGDEIILAPFPNLYVFKWNKAVNKMEPMWWFPNCYSNNCIINDFDKDGINELGFNTFSNLEFVEYNNKFNGPDAPGNLDGWALSNKSALLFWNKVAKADYYEIYALKRTDTDIILLPYGMTNDTSLIIDTLGANINYEFTIRSVSLSLPDKYSDFVLPALKIYTHDLIKPLLVTALDSVKLKVDFSGLLSTGENEPASFILDTNIYNIDNIPATTSLLNDSILVLTFLKPLVPGVHKLNIKSIIDYYNSPTLHAVLDFTYIPEKAPEQELFLKKLDIVSFTRLTLQFSEDIDDSPNSLDINNYILKPLGRIIDISQISNQPAQVAITLSKDAIGALGKDYTITVVNVDAKSGHKMTKGAGNTLGFVFSASNPDNAFVYPDPVVMSEHPSIYFANLTYNSEVSVYTLDGEKLVTLTERNGNGGVEWDGRNSKGELLGTGIYLFKVTYRNVHGNLTESSLKKFAIIK